MSTYTYYFHDEPIQQRCNTCLRFRTLGNIVTGNDTQTDAVLAAQVSIKTFSQKLCRSDWGLDSPRNICTAGCSSVCQASATPQDEHSEGSCLDNQQHYCWKQHSNPGHLRNGSNSGIFNFNQQVVMDAGVLQPLIDILVKVNILSF